MPQRDYVLRQIEILGAALLALKKKILAGRADRTEVEEGLQELSGKGGMALDLAKACTPETLRMLIAPTGEVEPGKCWLMAETLYLDGLFQLEAGGLDQALDSLAKAKMLFSLLKPMGAFLAGFPEASERMTEIDGLLED